MIRTLITVSISAVMMMLVSSNILYGMEPRELLIDRVTDYWDWRIRNASDTEKADLKGKKEYDLDEIHSGERPHFAERSHDWNKPVKYWQRYADGETPDCVGSRCP